MGKSLRGMKGKTSNAQRPTSNVELGGEKTLVGGFNFGGRNDEGDGGDRIAFVQEFVGDFDGDRGGVGDPVAGGAATDGGEGDRPHSVLEGDTKGVAVTIRERLRFAAISAGPNGADGVD